MGGTVAPPRNGKHVFGKDSTWRDRRGRFGAHALITHDKAFARIKAMPVMGV